MRFGHYLFACFPKVSLRSPNKTLHRPAIPLRSIAGR